VVFQFPANLCSSNCNLRNLTQQLLAALWQVCSGRIGEVCRSFKRSQSDTILYLDRSAHRSQKSRRVCNPLFMRESYLKREIDMGLVVLGVRGASGMI
jgi:hypothetical protein